MHSLAWLIYPILIFLALGWTALLGYLLTNKSRRVKRLMGGPILPGVIDEIEDPTKWASHPDFIAMRFAKGGVATKTEVRTVGGAPYEHVVAQYPHCDGGVLHAPGQCVYCDAYPNRQLEREVNKVLFTGQTLTHEMLRAGWKRCPSEKMRPLDVIEKWPGNRPKKWGMQHDSVPEYLRNWAANLPGGENEH